MSSWHVLPAYLVRLAGFAFHRLDVLRLSSASTTLDALVAAEETRRAVGQAFDLAVSQARYADNPAFDDPALRKAVSKQVKSARASARQIVQPLPVEALREVVRVIPQVAGLVDELQAAHTSLEAARAAYSETFATDFERSRGALRTMFESDERLQESVFLESPEAFDRLQQLISTTGPRNARARQRERLAAMYAQRFCAKNDTNSICGPHGVAYVPDVDPGGAARIEVVREDVRRESYFSHWSAQRVLDEAASRAGEAARITERLHPTARVGDSSIAWCVMDHDATTSFRRRYARSNVPSVAADLLRQLTQPRTRAEIFELAAELGLEADEAAGFLDELVEAGVLIRGPVLAPGLFRPLQTVAEELSRWEPSEGRDWGLAEVAALDELVAKFGRAGLQDRLVLFQQLVERFTASTGTAATRGEGRHYADRSVIHEDACAEVVSDLGPVRAQLDRTLPVLMAALELPQEMARERVREWYRARFPDADRVPALDAHRAFDEDRVLETACATTRAGELRAAIAAVRDLLAAASIGADGIARVSVEQLQAAMEGVTPPTHAGYVSVDVMIRQQAAGATELVLGEVHGFFWLPTCLLDVLPDEHRERVVEQMRAAVRTMGHGLPTAECVFIHTQATDRRFQLASTDLQLMVPSDVPGALDLGALDMSLEGGAFKFFHGTDEVVPLVAYTNYPFMMYTSSIAPLFDDFAERFFPDSLLPTAYKEQDSPRLLIGDVVVRRRTWRRPVAAVRAALAATTEAELFQRAQAFRREVGCDSYVFVSLSGEPKPILLDFQNVFLLEALINMLERQAEGAVLKISEMLPGPDELLARGPDGHRTAELRMGFYRA